MTGIGNDIVALKTIDSLRTRSPRFYTKILSAAEQDLYHARFANLPLEHFVWLLWSIKESAYKCLQRHQPELVFSPVKFELQHLVIPSISPPSFHEELTAIGFNDAECFCGEAIFNGQILYTRSLVHPEAFILSVVQPSPNFDSVNWGLKQIQETNPESQSNAVREFLLERLGAMYPEQELSIRKNGTGCPHLFADGRDTKRPFSLSHHGGYVGYAFV